ncbi:hypothetical protein HKD37_17G048505 [Glycine soja]
MVRTRGLGHALGRAIGKVLGRRDESDVDAPRRRRPTASACRQRQQQVVLEDPSTAEEELVDIQAEAPIDEGDADVEGFPCRPHDTSVLSDFENHIALRVWNGELKLSSHGRKVAKLGRPAPEIEGLVVASGLSPLIDCSLDTLDWGLTAFHSFEQLNVDDVVDLLVELLEVNAGDARAETIRCNGSYVRLSWLRDMYELKIEACAWIVAAVRVTLGALLHLCTYPVVPLLSYAENDDRWMRFGDPLRVPPLQEEEQFVEPHMYEQPMATTAPNEADIDQHDLRHAVYDFATIADRLDRLLNLRILTEGTEAYVVVEECVGIARRYTGDPPVAYKSRRRRRTDGH